MATSKLVISTKKHFNEEQRHGSTHTFSVGMVNCDWLSHEHPHPTESHSRQALWWLVTLLYGFMFETLLCILQTFKMSFLRSAPDLYLFLLMIYVSG